MALHTSLAPDSFYLGRMKQKNMMQGKQQHKIMTAMMIRAIMPPAMASDSSTVLQVRINPSQMLPRHCHSPSQSSPSHLSCSASHHLLHRAKVLLVMLFAF